MATTKSKSGLQAALAGVTKGTLVEGDGLTALADNSWYMIASVAASGSALPFEKVGQIFKTPDSANAITPIADDDVWPLTVDVKCKVTSELTNEKGTIDVSDDCSEGYMSNITDGFTNISGSYEQYIKFDDTTKGIVDAQKEVLNRFYDIATDDGEGTYTLTSKNDEDLLLFIFLNRAAAVGEKQTVLIVPTILGSANTTQDNKAAMGLSVSWVKAEGLATYYERVINSEEGAQSL